MDLRLLEIFCRVYRLRSFSRAARELGLTQPTISAHIRDLEKELGTPLFQRVGRETEPTDAGYFLYENGQSIVTFKQDLAESFGRFLNRIEGKLTVGASSVPGEYILPPIIAAFQKKHPTVRARLRIKDTAEIIEDVRAGEVHLGVVGRKSEQDDLEFRDFARDRLVLIVPATKKWIAKKQISIDDLKREMLIVREPGSGTRAILEERLAALAMRLDEFRLGPELGSTSAVKEAVKGGHGVSFISQLAVRAELRHRTLATVRVKKLEPIPRRYYVVTSTQRIRSPLNEAFLQTLMRKG
ncbi:MAG TPA: selenium metabolism-associated LysR family transcriptional regulator [Thermoanaerobaculia bacterium]